MDSRYKIEPFISLGGLLGKGLPCEVEQRAIEDNGWFTSRDIHFAIDVLVETLLNRQALEEWLEGLQAPKTVRDVCVVMAGNIPLAGFYDMMCVLISGHRCFIKPSSKDGALMDFVVESLLSIDSSLPIYLADENTQCDALIFSGGDAAAQIYRDRYAGVAMIMRTSRFSVAVLDGAESESQLEDLSDDVLRYFGLGCRNVSMVFVPEDYEPRKLATLSSVELKKHSGFKNNYRAARALRLMENAEIIDLDGFILRQGEAPSKHLSELVYCRYQDISQVKQWLENNNHKIQCVVCSEPIFSRSCRFGDAQRPRATDFADGVDVMDFLNDI